MAKDQVPVLKLRLKKPKNDRKVQWTTETVDNEHMNRKKSKCCCIYEKPRVFGESSSSSSESDGECEHCQGHVERKKKARHTHTIEQGGSGTVTIVEDKPANIPVKDTDKKPENDSQPPN